MPKWKENSVLEAGWSIASSLKTLNFLVLGNLFIPLASPVPQMSEYRVSYMTNFSSSLGLFSFPTSKPIPYWVSSSSLMVLFPWRILIDELVLSFINKFLLITVINISQFNHLVILWFHIFKCKCTVTLWFTKI